MSTMGCMVASRCSSLASHYSLLQLRPRSHRTPGEILVPDARSARREGFDRKSKLVACHITRVKGCGKETGVDYFATSSQNAFTRHTSRGAIQLLSWFHQAEGSSSGAEPGGFIVIHLTCLSCLRHLGSKLKSNIEHRIIIL